MNGALSIRRSRGFSLIELLVAMAIGLIVTLAVTSVLVRSESSKRSSTSVNEINQTGAYAAFALDRTVRSAGSGYSQRWSIDYGCLLDAAKGGAALLPIPAAAISASSAFAKLTTSPALPIRLAPLIIAQGYANTGSEIRGDVLLVMAGSAGAGELPQPVNTGSVTTTNLQLPNTLGYRTEDLVLLADPAQTSCMLQQVKFTTTPPSATFAPSSPQPGGSTDQELPFGNGTLPGYYNSTGTNVNLTAFGANSLAIQLGSAVDNRPQFVAYGVGQDRTLYSYDLLEPLPLNAMPDTPIADGVLEMRAIYGIDTTNPPDGTIDAWVPATGNFLASTLLDGSAASKSRLRRIVAVRVGMILRTSLQEKAPATSASGPTDTETFSQAVAANLTLFSGYSDPSGTSLAYTRSITTDEKRYRYRAVESTIPLRNVQLADSASVLAYP